MAHPSLQHQPPGFSDTDTQFTIRSLSGTETGYIRMLLNPKKSNLQRPNPKTSDLLRIKQNLKRKAQTPARPPTIVESKEEDEPSSEEAADDNDDDDGRHKTKTSSVHRKPSSSSRYAESESSDSEDSDDGAGDDDDDSSDSDADRTSRSHASRMSRSHASRMSDPVVARSKRHDDDSDADDLARLARAPQPRLYKESESVVQQNRTEDVRLAKTIALRELVKLQKRNRHIPSREFTTADSLDDIQNELRAFLEEDSLDSSKRWTQTFTTMSASELCDFNQTAFKSFLPIEGLDSMLEDLFQSGRIDAPMERLIRMMMTDGPMSPGTQLAWATIPPLVLLMFNNLRGKKGYSKQLADAVRNKSAAPAEPAPTTAAAAVPAPTAPAADVPNTRNMRGPTMPVLPTAMLPRPAPVTLQQPTLQQPTLQQPTLQQPSAEEQRVLDQKRQALAEKERAMKEDFERMRSEMQEQELELQQKFQDLDDMRTMMEEDRRRMRQEREELQAMLAQHRREQEAAAAASAAAAAASTSAAAATKHVNLKPLAKPKIKNGVVGLPASTPVPFAMVTNPFAQPAPIQTVAEQQHEDEESPVATPEQQVPEASNESSSASADALSEQVFLVQDDDHDSAPAQVLRIVPVAQADKKASKRRGNGSVSSSRGSVASSSYVSEMDLGDDLDV